LFAEEKPSETNEKEEPTEGESKTAERSLSVQMR